jgi:ribonuclease E
VPRETREGPVTREVRELREPREAREMRDGREVREVREPVVDEQVATSAASERTRRNKRNKTKGKHETSDQPEDSSLANSAQESGSQSPRTKSATLKKKDAKPPGRPKRPTKKPGSGNASAL